MPRQSSRDEARREHAQKMRKRRKRRRRLTCAAILFFLAALGIFLSLTVFFKIENITVTGDSRYTQEEIVAASGIQIGANLFLTNTVEAANQIEIQKPYIRTATIQRNLNGTIEITVEQTETASLAVRTDGGYVLLDSGLKVLESGQGDLPEGAVELRAGNITAADTGAQLRTEDPNAASAMGELLAAVDRAGLSGITLYDLSDTSDILMTYDGRLDVQVGTTDDLDRKMAMLAEVIRRNDATNPERTGMIDVRVSGKAYLSSTRTVTP